MRRERALACLAAGLLAAACVASLGAGRTLVPASDGLLTEAETA